MNGKPAASSAGLEMLGTLVLRLLSMALLLLLTARPLRTVAGMLILSVVGKLPSSHRLLQTNGCGSCGESGHMARQCPSATEGSGNDGKCFNCGEEG